MILHDLTIATILEDFWDIDPLRPPVDPIHNGETRSLMLPFHVKGWFSKKCSLTCGDVPVISLIFFPVYPDLRLGQIETGRPHFWRSKSGFPATFLNKSTPNEPRPVVQPGSDSPELVLSQQWNGAAYVRQDNTGDGDGDVPPIWQIEWRKSWAWDDYGDIWGDFDKSSYHPIASWMFFFEWL